MRRTLWTTLAAALAATATMAAPLLWRPATTRDLLAHSQVVVSARIVDIARGAPGPDCVDVATLQVNETLVGYAPSTVQLAFPGKARGTVTASGALIPEDNPAFIRYDLDQEGVYFLMDRGDGTYSANHPARFKPLFFLDALRRELAQATTF